MGVLAAQLGQARLGLLDNPTDKEAANQRLGAEPLTMIDDVSVDPERPHAVSPEVPDRDRPDPIGVEVRPHREGTFALQRRHHDVSAGQGSTHSIESCLGLIARQMFTLPAQLNAEGLDKGRSVYAEPLTAAR